MAIVTHTTTATGGDSGGLIGQTAWNANHSVSLDDGDFANRQITMYTEDFSPTSITSGTVTLSMNTSRNFVVAHSSNITTLNITNVPVAGYMVSIVLSLTTSGAFSFTTPASWKFSATPAAPTSGKTNIYTGMTYNGGTTWYMNYLGAF